MPNIELDMRQQEEFNDLENQKIDILVKWMIESLQKLVIYYFLKSSFHICNVGSF